MITRRRVVIALGAGALAPRAAFAQQPTKVFRIGYLSGSNVQTNASWLGAFRQGMADLRWVEGRDYVIDARYAEGVMEVQARLAAELVATQPDLLLTSADIGARMFSQKTRTIPIVVVFSQDPLGSGHVTSLRRPGGNLTGLTNLAQELGAKRLQLLKEAFPRVTHAVVLFDSIGPAQAREIEQAAPRLKMRVTTIELMQLSDIEPAFNRGAAIGAQAYILTAGPLFILHRQAIADLLLRSRLPAIYSTVEFVEVGGLMSYGSSRLDNFRRAAGYVDKILKGAKPGDLPIEQPTIFDLAINVKTAKALGIKFPNSILVQATRLIE